jgi:hypothetical protein
MKSQSLIQQVPEIAPLMEAFEGRFLLATPRVLFLVKWGRLSSRF